MSLIARHLEAHGIPTVILGSALDIVEHCGVPRFLYTDFPLGNPVGPPFERAIQRDVLRRALELFEAAEAPRTTAIAPWRFSDDDGWRARFLEVTNANRAELAAKGDARRAERAHLRATGQARQDA